MTTELEQLGSRAANDASVNDPVLSRAIAKAIETTRRQWTAPAEERLSPDALIAVSVGHASLTCDGEVRYEQNGAQTCDAMTVAAAEGIASHQPERDWRIHLIAQLEDRHYRRMGPGQWVIYERGYGMS
jgi:hypothetical protein